MMGSRRPRFLLAVSAFVALSLSVRAAVYHVGTDGLASNAGTAEAPLASIAEAVKAMSPGDTCLIHAGTYRETVVVERSGG